MFTFAQILLSSFALASSLAVPAAKDDRGGPEHARAGICEKLACTDAQRTELTTIKKELRADNEADHEAIAKLERELGSALAQAKPVKADIDRILAEIGKHRAEMAERGEDALLEFHAKLDAKQKAELGKLVSEHGVRAFMHGGGHGHGKGKGKHGDKAGHPHGGKRGPGKVAGQRGAR